MRETEPIGCQCLSAETKRLDGKKIIGAEPVSRSHDARRLIPIQQRGCPVPSSATSINFFPASSIEIEILFAFASREFSSSSFTTDAGRSITSPAAICDEISGESKRIGMKRLYPSAYQNSAKSTQVLYNPPMRFSTIFFDLDDTLYPSSSGLWKAIKERMNIYMRDMLHIPEDEVPALREQYYKMYGTTLRGLIRTP